MSINKFQIVFFFLFIVGVILLNFFIFLPYLSILFLSLVFAIVFDPLYQKLLRMFGGRELVAATLAVFLVFVIIVGPISFLGTILFQEASDLYVAAYNSDSGASSLSQQMHIAAKSLQALFPGSDISSIEVDVADVFRQGLSWLMNHLSVFLTGFVEIAFGLFLMLLSLFYFFKDGKKFIDSVVLLSPLSDASDHKIIERIFVAVNSVVRGSIVIGVLQGFLTGLGFFLLGVPSPVVWGLIAAIASLVPIIGTALVLIPGILFLALTGLIPQAIGLFVWGVIAVGLVDNLFGPAVIRKGIKIHPLLILLSALGGISFLGPVGFLAGPVILALLFALLDIYPTMVRGGVSRE